MRFSLPFRRRFAPGLLATVCVDGDTGRYLLANGPDAPERGKLREARTCPVPEIAHYLSRDAETFAEAEGSDITALSAAVDGTEHIAVTLAEELASAPEAQRQAYAVSMTSWASEDAVQKAGLTVAMMLARPEGDTYVVGAAPTREVDAARDRVGLDSERVRVTTLGAALVELFRATHGEEATRSTPVLLVLANDTFVETAVVEAGAPRAFSRATIAELVDEVVPRTVAHGSSPTAYAPADEPEIDDAGDTDASDADVIDADLDDDPTVTTTSRVSGARPEGFVGGGYDSSVVESARLAAAPAPERRARERRADVDQMEVTHAAYRLALRRALELYTSIATDEGIEAYATDVDLVYVTGAGVHSYGALDVARDYFTDQAAVRPLEVTRATYVYDDPALAAEIGDHEHAYADVLALAALARRPDLLALEPYARPAWSDAAAGAPYAAPTIRADGVHGASSRHRPMIVTLAVFVLLTLPVLAAWHFAIRRESARLDRDLGAATERARALAKELEARKADAARVADNEANNKVIAEAEARNGVEISLFDDVRAVFEGVNNAGDEARIDGMGCDAADGFSLSGTVPDTAGANRLVQALANQGNGRFHELDLKTDTTASKESRPSADDPTRTEDVIVERVRFTVRGHYTK